MAKIELELYDVDNKLIDTKSFTNINDAMDAVDKANNDTNYFAMIRVNGRLLSQIDHVREEQLRKANLSSVRETSDDSLGATMYQGKPLS